MTVRVYISACPDFREAFYLYIPVTGKMYYNEECFFCKR